MIELLKSADPSVLVLVGVLIFTRFFQITITSSDQGLGLVIDITLQKMPVRIVRKNKKTSADQDNEDQHSDQDEDI